MFTLKVENPRGEILTLTNNRNYDVIKIEGLTPPATALNFTSLVNLDGSQYNSGRLDNRNIVITIVLHGNVEKNRINLYKYFPIKKQVRLYFKNDTRDVYIDGYIESFECDLFELGQKVQISVICPSPYFKSTDTAIIKFANLVDLFEFPFSTEEEGIPFSELSISDATYNNTGDIDIGMVITLQAIQSASNPTIYNRTTGEQFGLNYALQEGDIITIDTISGEKSVKLNRKGIISNIINSVQQGSKWIQLVSGVNELSYQCDEGASALQIIISAVNIFEGV